MLASLRWRRLAAGRPVHDDSGPGPGPGPGPPLLSSLEEEADADTDTDRLLVAARDCVDTTLLLVWVRVAAGSLSPSLSAAFLASRCSDLATCPHSLFQALTR